MAESTIVQCQRCGQMNRIRAHGSNQTVICGKCHATIVLPTRAFVPPPRLNFLAFLKRHVAWIILIGVIVGAVYTGTRPTRPQQTRPQPRRIASFPHPEQTLPFSGSVRIYTTAEKEAPFEIKAAAGSHYLVKLVDGYTGTPVLTVFVRSGTTINVDVPLGTYELRYACGSTWYGYKLFFGPDTAYSKADKTFTFEVVGNQARGFTITLYKVAHGNLHTSAIRATEF